MTEMRKPLESPLHSKRWAIGTGALLVVGLFAFLIRTPFTPKPVAPPVETINPDDWKSLVSAVQRQAQEFNGSVGYVIKDMRTGAVTSSRADHPFLSASLIKVPILCAAYQAVEEGKMSLSAPIVLAKGDRRGGSGLLKNAPVGSVYTNRELLELLIIHSDNTAAELLVRQLGYEYMRETFTRFGLRETQIHPEGFSLSSRRVKMDNITSPRDMALLLEKIYRGTLVSREASAEMLDILKRQKLRDRLPRYLPTGWKIAHKTGLLRKACHDVGIVYSPKGEYMICVLTGQDVNYTYAKQFIASVGRITFDHYLGASHRASVPVRANNQQARRSYAQDTAAS